MSSISQYENLIGYKNDKTDLTPVSRTGQELILKQGLWNMEKRLKKERKKEQAMIALRGMAE